jgi:hypothetical protein
MKFIKTLLLSTLIFGAISISSCSKNDDGDTTIEGSITANINGVPTKFNTNVIATSATTQGKQLTSINGTAADGTNISIVLAGNITTGKIYASNAADDNDKPLVAFSTAVDDFLNDDSSVTNIATVTVTSITSNTISGTFKGDLKTVVIGNAAPKTTAITDGKFNVSLIK